jgi:hypothetical protein
VKKKYTFETFMVHLKKACMARYEIHVRVGGLVDRHFG